MLRVMPETRGRGVEGTPSPICRLYRRVHQAEKMGRWLGDPSNRREVQKRQSRETATAKVKISGNKALVNVEC